MTDRDGIVIEKVSQRLEISRQCVYTSLVADEMYMGEIRMFYCEECRESLDYPESFFRSSGRCEICGHGRLCYDMPSKHLPMTTPKKPIKHAPENALMGWLEKETDEEI